MRRTDRHLSRRVARRRGFTLVEVMVSIAVMTVGAVAIFTMQSITATGARRSRQITTATEINRQWLERVKLQAATWSGDRPVTAIPWLNQLPEEGTGSSGWVLPVENGADASLVTPASSWQGTPIAIPASGGPVAPYCTAIRLTWLSSTLDQIARVDVRTWWHRGERAGATIEGCGADQEAVTAALADLSSYGSVQGSTVIRWQGAAQ